VLPELSQTNCMRSLSIKNIQPLSVYSSAVLVAVAFWVFESLMKGSFQPPAPWFESFIPDDPIELWFRLFVGVIIIGLVIDFKQKAVKIRHLEAQLCSESRGIRDK
jgi:hypothetical protein